MNPSLFRAESRQVLLDRIAALRDDSPRAWGKMNPAQALAHLSIALEAALGDTRLKRTFIGRLIGKSVLKKALSDKPWGRGAPTHKTYIVADQRKLETERTKLLALVKRVGAAGPAGMAKDPHPFFGPMTPEQWDLLMWRHIDHHLRQFNV